MTNIGGETLVARYGDWLRLGLSAQELDDGCRLTTPFLDRHRNLIQVYVDRLANGNLLLSDDGHVMRDLQVSGFELEGERRQEILETTLRSFGIRLHEKELSVETTEDEFPRKKHDLVQAMLAIGDLIVVAQPTVATMFVEDVASFLEANRVQASPRLKLTGSSGLDHSFDFLIPQSNGTPERILKAIATPSRPQFIEVMFAWDDVQDHRPDNSEAFAIINDAERTANPNLLAALGECDIHAVLWSKRQDYVEQLRR